MSLEEALGAFGTEWQIEQDERFYGEAPYATMADQHSQWHWENGWNAGCPLDCAGADHWEDDPSEDVELVTLDMVPEDPWQAADAEYVEPPF